MNTKLEVLEFEATVDVTTGGNVVLKDTSERLVKMGKEERRYRIVMEPVEPEPKQEGTLKDKMEFDAEVFDAGPHTAYNHPGVVVLAISHHDPDLGALERLKGYYRVTMEPLVPELRPCMCGGHPEHDLRIYRVWSYLSDDLVVTERDDGAENFQVWCGQCGCRGPIAPSEREAAEKWNRWWAV